MIHFRLYHLNYWGIYGYLLPYSRLNLLYSFRYLVQLMFMLPFIDLLFKLQLLRYCYWRSALVSKLWTMIFSFNCHWLLLYLFIFLPCLVLPGQSRRQEPLHYWLHLGRHNLFRAASIIFVWLAILRQCSWSFRSVISRLYYWISVAPEIILKLQLIYTSTTPCSIIDCSTPLD